jgi:hypothetical protein
MSDNTGAGPQFNHLFSKVKPSEFQQANVKPSDEIVVEQHNVNVKLDEDLPSEDKTSKTIKVKLLREVVDSARTKKQRISIWSPEISAALWYLKLTIPNLSISDVAERYVLSGLKKEYPDLMEKLENELRTEHGGTMAKK